MHPGAEGFALVFEVLSAFGWSFVILAVIRRVRASGLVSIAVTLWIGRELTAHGAPLDPGDDTAGFVLAAAWTVADHAGRWQVEYPVGSWLPFVLIGCATAQPVPSASEGPASGYPTRCAAAPALRPGRPSTTRDAGHHHLA